MFHLLRRTHLYRLANNLRMASTLGPTKLKGKVAIVTASTDGIGYAIARRLGQDGAKVVISSRKQQNVDKALEKLKAENLDVMGMVCHVGKSEHRQKLIQETVKQCGGIDILVSNAAANPFMGPIFDCPEEAWDKIFDINVKATFLLCKEALPYMEERGGGSIIIITSIAAYSPFEAIAPYSVSKTALLGLIKAMTPQCGKMNIRVNGIAPGVINTHFSSAIINNPDLLQKLLDTVPIGRYGEPDDISGAASFLASDDSLYMSGETLVIAGGSFSKL